MAALACLLLIGSGLSEASEVQDSYNTLLQRLTEPQPQTPQRPRIITKYDFMQTRQEKSAPSPAVPAPFTISTGLTVTEKEQEAARRRGGRSFRIGRRTTAGRGLNLARAVEVAPLIQGIRLPDDETDQIIHRGGRFINNVFVPGGSNLVLPREYTVRGGVGAARQERQLSRSSRSYSTYVEDAAEYSPSNYVEDVKDYRQPSFAFRDFYSGRRQDMEDAMAMESRQDTVFMEAPESLQEESSSPVYFLNEDPDSLHADRSPYTFEPAAQVPAPSSQQSSVITASSDDFIIKQHTYQMCPTCPTFSIPIPVPKSSASSGAEVTNPYSSDPGYQYQHGESASLASRLMSWASPLLDTARSRLASLMGPTSNSLEPAATFSDRLSPSSAASSPASSPLLLAGLAAAGLGFATLFSSGLQLLSLGGSVGRAFGEAEGDSENSIGGALAEYNMQDLLCMPRMYCEKLKRRKHVIDQYPNTKKVAAWLVGRIFQRDTVYSNPGEEPIYNKCNLRECLMALLD